ncbi:MAG TPA: hypothetical protein PLZ93_19495 [Nocardioides sp.]|mgnify:CR=1 FL=1|uniref:hypothetical protein n=1 Tax=uncultured Nocardioides sp. TaxID=198441 RepID=UPI0026387F7F|nr:hypothetical protein [uncultured Nocardioides sp.]HRI97814.1 hypothetical protein [Nocardioides sp.]HRK47207.1 hypothetical protein [Nocardioides sp.]
MTRASDYYRVVARTSERRAGVDLPGPWRHAAMLRDSETLCGVPVASLNRFDHLPYQELDPVMRCRACSTTFTLLVSGLG